MAARERPPARRPLSVLIVALATFAAASLQSASGFGFALIAGPAFFAVLGPEEAVATVLCLGATVNLLMLAGERRPTEIRSADLILPLVLAIPGLALGVLVLSALDKEPLQVAVGISVLAAVALMARPRALPPHRPDGQRAPIGDSAVGLTVGVLTTSTSVNGPPLLLWLLAKGATPVEVRDTLALAFVSLNLAGLAVLVVAEGGLGVLDADVLLLLPLTAAGWLAGRLVFRGLDPQRFRTLNLGLAAAAGVASLVAGAL